MVCGILRCCDVMVRSCASETTRMSRIEGRSGRSCSKTVKGVVEKNSTLGYSAEEIESFLNRGDCR